MLKSSFIELIRTFSPEELKKFDLFIRSPYFNTIANASVLYSAIRNFAPEFSSEMLKKELLWKKVFPGKEYNYGIMKNLIHVLTKLSQKFITVESFESHRLYQDDLLTEELFSRNAGNLFTQKMREIERSYSGNSLRDLGFESGQFYFVSSNMFWHRTFHEKVNNLKMPGERDFLQGSAYSSYASIILMTKAFNNILAGSFDNKIDSNSSIPTILLKELNAGKLDEVLETVREHSERDYRILSCYVALNKAQLFPTSSEYYYHFKNKLTEHYGLFSKSDLKDLFNCLATTLSHLDRKEINIQKEMVNNFNQMADIGILANADGSMGSMYYYYYMIAAFRSMDFENIECFSKKFLGKISDEKSENADTFTRALLSFGRSDYDGALQLISNTDYTALFMKFFIREFEAACFYELNEYLMFENEYKTLYHFLKNNELDNPRMSEGIKKTFENVKKLFRLRENFDPAEFSEFRTSNSVSFTDKLPWIQRKITELEANAK